MARKLVKENRRLMSSAELPPCKGPKLQAFKHRSARIHWGDCISGIGGKSEELGSQAYVFKVEIRSRTYALKVFKFFKPSTQRFVLGPIRGRSVSDDELAFHTDPFFAECRAYGRIEQARRNEKRVRKVAALCHGFLALSARDEEHLKRNGFDLWPETLPPSDEYRTMAEGSPVRAIVKEYIEHDPDPDLRAMNLMLKDIRFLNRNRCLNRDIRRANYRNGLLVDFGCAWTEPHCLIKLASKERVETWKMTDKIQFDTMAMELGFGDAIHAIPVPNKETLKKLRKREHSSKDDDAPRGQASSVASSSIQSETLKPSEPNIPGASHDPGAVHFGAVSGKTTPLQVPIVVRLDATSGGEFAEELASFFASGDFNVLSWEPFIGEDGGAMDQYQVVWTQTALSSEYKSKRRG